MLKGEQEVKGKMFGIVLMYVMLTVGYRQCIAPIFLIHEATLL